MPFNSVGYRTNNPVSIPVIIGLGLLVLFSTGPNLWEFMKLIFSEQIPLCLGLKGVKSN